MRYQRIFALGLAFMLTCSAPAVFGNARQASAESPPALPLLPYDVVWALHGNMLAYSSTSGWIVVNRLTRSAKLISPSVHVLTAAWSPNGAYIAWLEGLPYSYGTLRVATPSGELVWQSKALCRPDATLQWSRDGSILATAQSDSKAVLVDAAHHKAYYLPVAGPPLIAENDVYLPTLAGIEKLSLPSFNARPIRGTAGFLPSLVSQGRLFAVPSPVETRPLKRPELLAVDLATEHVTSVPIPGLMKDFATSVRVLAASTGILYTAIGQEGISPRLWGIDMRRHRLIDGGAFAFEPGSFALFGNRALAVASDLGPQLAALNLAGNIAGPTSASKAASASAAAPDATAAVPGEPITVRYVNILSADWALEQNGVDVLVNPKHPQLVELDRNLRLERVLYDFGQ